MGVYILDKLVLSHVVWVILNHLVLPTSLLVLQNC